MNELICAATLIFNTKSSWSQEDDKNLLQAQKRCEQIYPDAPCLVRFYKREPQVYWAVCGEAPENTRKMRVMWLNCLKKP